MFHQITEFLESIPLDFYETKEEWTNDCIAVWNTYKESLERKDFLYGTAILHSLLKCFTTFQEPRKMERVFKETNIQRILAMPQIEQRTENWYKEYQQILSGSQYATLFKGARTRGQLVLEKAGLSPKEVFDRPLAVPTTFLNPMTWGIRFEPVVQQLYMKLTNTKLQELGRLRHSTNLHLGASPDGLVIEGDRMGRFVEFKAPISRVIYNKVPEDYMIQMQIQMEVGDVELCDYLEVRFVSAYKTTEYVPVEAPISFGIIALISNNETYRYQYSPLDTKEWTPALEEGDELVEMIPWHTSEWFLTTIPRDKEWYETVGKPAEEAFWKDVEAAKRGEWTLPEPAKIRVKKEKYNFIED